MADVETNIRTLHPASAIAPIRPLDEAAALDWLRAQPGGRTKLSAAELGRRWGWPRQRTGRHLKTWAKAGLVKRRGDTIAVVEGASVALVPSDAPGTAAAPVPRAVPAHVPPAVPLPLHRGSIGRYVASGLLAVVGIGLSAIGMIETATYSLAAGGFLFCALAIGADALTLTMPATIRALWWKRSPAVVLAGLMWCVGIVVTVENIAGYVGEHVEQYQAGRETGATERSMALERLAQLRGERKAIIETRPAAAILAAMAGARRSEQPALREALAMARRRDVVDLELVAFEKRLIDIPRVATADASAAVLSEIGGMMISEMELRRFRLALLLGLPLCGGLVLALALATASARR